MISLIEERMVKKMTKDEKQLVLWNPRYSLGVEEIDKEHQRLFSIINKILQLSEDEEEARIQHACREGVKFFKNYTIIHFEHEENFMLSLNYGDYDRHKKIHDDLKNNVLPAMEQELETNDYNLETVRHFLGICTAWLTTHIKGEDQAIVNRQVYHRMRLEIDSLEIRFERALEQVVQEMFELKLCPISNQYTGWDFGKAIFHELIFADENREVTYLLFTLEQRLIFSLAAQDLGIEFKKIDTFLLAAIKEILHVLGSKLSFHMGLAGQYKSRSGVVLSTGEIKEVLADKTIIYSTLFKTELGNFACSLYKR